MPLMLGGSDDQGNNTYTLILLIEATYVGIEEVNVLNFVS